MSQPTADPWAEFRVVLAQARASLDRVRAERVHSPEERAILHRDALAGTLGEDMRTLARHVEAGDTTWAEAFEGDSAYSALLVTHVSRMLDEHREPLRRALEEDPTFDPFADDLER
jgi:hypothetical protein